MRSELQDSCHAIDKQLQETTKAAEFDASCVLGDPEGDPKNPMEITAGHPMDPQGIGRSQDVQEGVHPHV